MPVLDGLAARAVFMFGALVWAAAGTPESGGVGEIPRVSACCSPATAIGRGTPALAPVSGVCDTSDGPNWPTGAP